MLNIYLIVYRRIVRIVSRMTNNQENKQNKMVQYCVWPTCANNNPIMDPKTGKQACIPVKDPITNEFILDENGEKVLKPAFGCAFCLRDNRDIWIPDLKIKRIKEIYDNLDVIDWSEYSGGMSMLGGEIYCETNKLVQEEFLKLIDKVIIVMKEHPWIKWSTVTNGMYMANFLFQVLDKLVSGVGIDRLDINFSYDKKYRYANEFVERQVLLNIRTTCKRYNYTVGVQTILTSYLINDILSGRFNIKKFEKNEIKGAQLTFLYPHPINPLLPKLDDFFFSRSEFFKWVKYMKMKFPRKFDNFYLSCYNSAIYKATGARDVFKTASFKQPELSDGKEIMNNKCNHSVLYQCYSDCSNCLICDLESVGRSV